MARIFTTPEAAQTAKAWLHDLMVAADIRKSQRGINSALARFVTTSSEKPHAKALCDELINRDFANVNTDIKELAYYNINVDMQGSNWKRVNENTIAKSIVYMAELLNLYWDDTIRTPYEVDEFKKTTLGAAVFKYGRYISAIKDKRSKSSSRTSAGGAKTPGQPPKNNYKQSGPQSGNVRDLQDLNGGPGIPGHKVSANTNLIYKIIGDKPQSKNTPNVFIKPLSAVGATGNTNKIFISSGNGYTDCTCYFDDPNDAQDFLNKIEAAGRIPVDVSNMRVVKSKADSNGYFIVGTEFGPCAVSAKTLNEALKESAKEYSETSGWEKATKNYTNEELEELHTWMRRG